MSDIYWVIGFNIICFAMTFITVCIFAYDFSTKDKIKMIGMEVFFVALVTVGVMLMYSNK